MAVIKCCSTNGLIAVICDKILRVYSSNDSKLVHKYSFCEDPKTECAKSADENQLFMNTTFTHGCAFSKSGQFLAAFSDNKDLTVWQTGKDWKQVGKRKVPKRPTVVLFTNKEDRVIISDKAGDVYSYSISDITGLSNENLLLGHVSMILDMAISKDDQYIITADRDEKIRVSCFPNSYNIETFCLGHKEYVWKVMMVETVPDIIVSASGDGTVRFWNFKLGTTIHVEAFADMLSDTSTTIVSCLACSKRNNIVFIGLDGSSLVYIFKVTEENKVISLPSASITLDGSPCSMSVDHNDCLWVIQSHRNLPVVVFEMKNEVDNYKFNRLSCPKISLLLSIEGWDLIYDGLKQKPCLENLKKKEQQGSSQYYNRKRSRIEAKRKKTENSEIQTVLSQKKLKP